MGSESEEVDEPRRPRPVLTPETEPFWESCAHHAMALPRCTVCGRSFFPPSTMCPSCWSTSIEWATVSGRGRVFSFVTFHRLYDRSFESLLPYSVAVVELDEGPRVLSRIAGEEPSIGDAVEVCYEDLGDATLPLFRSLVGANG